VLILTELSQNKDKPTANLPTRQTIGQNCGLKNCCDARFDNYALFSLALAILENWQPVKTAWGSGLV
jgi:hypothetical protein